MDEEAPGEQVFEITIDGAVSPAALTELGDVEVSAQELRTVLSGEFKDQADLHGFLQRLRGFALEIVEVRRVVVTREDPDEPTGH
jgi:hypothetical protein